jgi:hypothetical protein
MPASKISGGHAFELYNYYLFGEGKNSCVLVCGGGYNMPMFVYYFIRNIRYDLLDIEAGDSYGDDKYYKEIISIFILDKNIDLIVKNPLYLEEITTQDSETVMVFGKHFQLGHYLWNEVSGIDILVRTNLIKKIDVLLLGDYDICDMYKIIKEYNPVCKIINIKDKSSIIENYKNNYGMISGYFITDTTKKYYLKNIDAIKFDKKIVMMIIIKADRRIMKDMEIIYANLINKLVENNILNPKETIILFEGLYCNKINSFLENYYNRFIDRYKYIANTITENINKDFECISLLELTFPEILRYYNSVNFWIGGTSSTIDLISQTNKNGIIFTPENFRYTIMQQCFYIQNRINHETIFTPTVVDDLFIANEEELYKKAETIINSLNLQ